MKISFIGFGNIAKAVARGLLKNPGYSLQAAAPSLPIGTTKEGIRTHYDNSAILSDADVIMLAVKPAQMLEVFPQIHSLIPSNCLVISLASGLTLDWFNEQCKIPLSIVRAMPNIAAAIGKSATPLIANHKVNAAQKKRAEEIFTAIGQIEWLQQETDLDILTALSGSGPAYVFLFMEAMMDAAITLGLPEHTAKTFMLQTFAGALGLAETSQISLVELRKQVTSPAGTTAAALNVFHEQGLETLILDAMKAARNRAYELRSKK